MGDTFRAVNISGTNNQAPATIDLPHAAPGSMNTGGTLVFDAHSGEVEQWGYRRESISSVQHGTPGGSVAATLTKSGSMTTVEVIPGNPASRTDVRTAERLGLIRRDQSGNWVDADATAREAIEKNLTGTQDATQQAPQAQAESLFDAEDLDAWAEDIAPLPQHAYDAAVAGAVNMALGQGNLESVTDTLARSTGMEPALAQQYVEAGYEMHYRAAVKATGMPAETAEKVFQWAQEATPSGLHDAISRLVYAHDGSGFRELARNFRIANPPDTTYLKEAGFQTTIDRETGEVMVMKAGGSWRRLSELGR